MNKKELMALILTTAFKNKEGHIASAFSILDCLLCLNDEILKENDDFILSKGHASLALYAIMLKNNEITKEDFMSFCQFNSKLGGHPSSKKLKKVKVSTGSLGHGLPYAVGLALSKKINKEEGQIFCLIGDGEANEGTIWESALLAGSLRLDNLTCIMDFNGSGERAIKLSSCINKFESFFWKTNHINGHDKNEIKLALLEKSDLPKFIEIKTIKGKGSRIMENNPEWHHKQPSSEEELKKLIEDLKE